MSGIIQIHSMNLYCMQYEGGDNGTNEPSKTADATNTPSRKDPARDPVVSTGISDGSLQHKMCVLSVSWHRYG